MQIDKALDRLRWRFTSRKQFIPNKGDIEAFNSVVEYVETNRKELKRADILYNKLYVWAYRQHLAHYKASVFDKIPQVELHKLLEKPLAVHVQEFTDFLNDQEIYSAFDIAGVPDWSHIHLDHLRQVLIDHGVTGEKLEQRMAKLEKDREEYRGRLQEYLKEHPEIEAALYKGQKVWEFEDVAQTLGNLIAKTIEVFADGK